MAAPPSSDSLRAIARTEAHHAFLYTASAVLSQVGGLLLLPLFWRKLSVQDYGVIGVTDILCALFGVLWGLSLDVSISRFYYEWPEHERRGRLGTIWLLSWGSSIVFGFLTLLLLWLIHPVLLPDVQFFPYVVLGITNGVLVRMRLVTFATIRIQRLPGTYFLYSLWIFLTTLIANVIFVWVLDWGLFGYFLAWNLSGVIVVLMCTGLMLRFATVSLSTSGLAESVRFALPLIPTAVISSLATIVDRYLLHRFASLEALGIYTLCLRFVNIVTSLHDALKMSFAPFIFKTVSEHGAAAAFTISRIRLVYLLPILVLATAIAFYVKDFVKLMDQPAYSPVGDYVPLLVAVPVIMSLFAYFASGLLLAKRSDRMWVPTGVQLGAVVLGGLLLIPSLHLEGIVITRYISSMLFVGTGIILSQRYFPIPFHGTKLLLVFGVLGLAALSAHLNDIQSPWLSLLYSTCGVLAFSLVYALVIVGPARLARELKQRMRARRRAA